MKILAVIVAREGSERVVNKNMRLLAGLPLIGWACNAINETKLITDAIISTDSDEYGEYAESMGIKFVRRPLDISGSKADISEAVSHASLGTNFDYVVTLQAAVPMRPCGAIDALLSEVIASGARGGLSMVKRSPWMWQVDNNNASKWWGNKYPRSQDIEFSNYEEVNAIQVATGEIVKRGERWGFPLSIVELPAWCSVDVDDEEDLTAANEFVGSILHIYNKPRKYKTFTVRHNG